MRLAAAMPDWGEYGLTYLRAAISEPADRGYPAKETRP
jgi:hypothetical protein